MIVPAVVFANAARFPATILPRNPAVCPVEKKHEDGTQIYMMVMMGADEFIFGSCFFFDLVMIEADAAFGRL